MGNNQPSLKILIGFVCGLALLGLFPRTARADGIVIPDPPPIPDPIDLEDSWLTIRYHQVTVSIEDQVAITRVDQEFYNQHDWEVEGTYIFPIPEGAAISEFVMWVDGKAVEGNILAADQARKIYEDIVRQRRDPALLEYVGRGAVQARIFPIPPGDSRRIELEYTQVLEVEDGLVHYLYPLNTEKFSASDLENCSIRVEIDSRIPLRSIYSPTHQDQIYLEREGEYRALVGYEAQNVLPDQDFELIYSFSREEIGLNLLTYHDGQEGYFLLMASPAVKLDQVVPRDIVLVLDTSGSMEGEKLAQAKGAAAYVLEHLNPEDRFNVIAFSTGIRHFAYGLQPPTQAAEAAAWLESMPALGGTNINLALLEAAALRNPTEEGSSGRPLVLLFLTDGLPTEGVTDVQQILANIRSNSTSYLRLFAFGVGDDVNTELLDTLAEENRGLVRYVRPDEKIDEEVSGLFARIQTPVLTNLRLDFGDMIVDEIYPRDLPDLYSGTQLTLTGRYRLPGSDLGRTTIVLSGQVGSREYTYRYQADFGARPERRGQNDFIPRLWAARKIGYLLNQIRYQGENQEWVDAIIKLSLRYGIITPYTSFLIEEDDILSSEGWDQAADELLQVYSGPAVGSEAVEKADAESNLRSAESVPAPAYSSSGIPGEIGQPLVKYVGDRTFLERAGVWVDSQYDQANMETVRIGFGSTAYFDLIAAQPGLGGILALGERVIFIYQGQAYEIVSGEGDLGQLPEELLQPDPNTGAQSGGISQAFQRPPAICGTPLLLGLAVVGWGLKAKARA